MHLVRREEILRLLYSVTIHKRDTVKSFNAVDISAPVIYSKVQDCSTLARTHKHAVSTLWSHILVSEVEPRRAPSAGQFS